MPLVNSQKNKFWNCQGQPIFKNFDSLKLTVTGCTNHWQCVNHHNKKQPKLSALIRMCYFLFTLISNYQSLGRFSIIHYIKGTLTVIYWGMPSFSMLCRHIIIFKWIIQSWNENIDIREAQRELQKCLQGPL